METNDILISRKNTYLEIIKKWHDSENVTDDYTQGIRDALSVIEAMLIILPKTET